MKKQIKPVVDNIIDPSKEAAKKVASQKKVTSPSKKSPSLKSSYPNITSLTKNEDHSNAGDDLIFFE